MTINTEHGGGADMSSLPSTTTNMMSVGQPVPEADLTALSEKSSNDNSPDVSASGNDTFSQIDPVAEKKLLWKLDLIILPLFTLVYCCNFIDRTAIGNAKIAGIEKDLGMKGSEFNIALTIFYVCFILADVPSNLLMKKFGSLWIAILVISFGAVSLGTAFVRTYHQLIATRVLLGIAEGGTLAALVYLLARYYRRHEMVIRTGIFFGLAPSLAGAFGGLLASGLLSLNDFAEVKSWRKIFFVEGVITLIVGIACLYIIPADPLTTRIFNKAERELAISRLNADQIVKTDGHRESTSLRLIVGSFNIWTTVCMTGYALINISFQGLGLFLPTVVNSFGHFTVVQAQLRTVPPYVLSGLWSVGLVYWSFKMKRRAIPLIVTLCLEVIGYAMAISTRNPHARYPACFFSLVGTTPTGPMFLIWGTENAAPDTMRAVTTAVITGFGTVGAIIGVWSYQPKDAPDFHQGNSLNLGAASAAATMVLMGAIYLRNENQKRERGERDHRVEGKTPEELTVLGYRHPQFRYQV